MNLIAIETSTENCSVGLLHQGQIHHRSQVAPQKHAELVLGYLDDLLASQGVKKTAVDGIVFGQGPGAFTGVRIAMSVVQGLALAWHVPVMAVSTLHNLAYQIWHNDQDTDCRILVANDARMGEVYWADFDISNGQLNRNTQDQLHAPDEVKTSGFDVFTGSAFQSMIAADPNATSLENALPNAQTLLQMALSDFSIKAQNITDIKPAYIREKVVFN